jgi:hypothetical protein
MAGTNSVIDLTTDTPPNQRIESKRDSLELACYSDVKIVERESPSKRHKRQETADADFEELIIVEDTGKVCICNV